jgi:Flp pilus assembly protein TadB
MIPSVHPRLVNAPWWQWSLITGVPFAGLMVLFLGTRYPDGWIFLVSAGLVFGAVMGPIIARQARRLRPVIGSMSAEEYAQARRAAVRGPVPADPVLRQKTARLASHHYDELTRVHVPSLIALGLLFVLQVLAAVVSSPWFWLYAVFFAVLLALQVLSWRRMRRRIERLQAEGG